MRKIAAVLLVAVFVFSLCSCSVFQTALQDAMKSRENVKHVDYWQSEIPDTIPRISFGTYNEVYSSKTTDKDSISFMLFYSGVTTQDIDAYGKTLEEAGFDISTTEGYDDYSVMGMPAGYVDYDATMSLEDFSFMYPSVSVSLTPSDGSCFISISIENTSK